MNYYGEEYPTTSWKQKVVANIEDRQLLTSSCCFDAPDDETQVLTDAPDLLTAIKEVLRLAWEFDSVLCSDPEYIDTPSRKKRSVLDMWRLLSTYRPGVTLWDIMECLDSNKTAVSSWYCPTVHKRVFQLPENFKETRTPGWVSMERCDELGLFGEDWRKINE